MKILVSITSWNSREQKYIDKVIHNYVNEFTGYAELFFVLSYNYTPDIKIPSNAIVLPKSQYKNWSHVWSNKQYLKQYSIHHDYIVESDSDIVITKKNIDYYIEMEDWLKKNVKNDMDYLPGFLSYEEDKDKNRYLISMPSMFPKKRETLTIHGRQFIVPYSLHSCCFVCERTKYEKALKEGLSLTPTTIRPYSEPEFARTSLYFKYKKIIPMASIADGSALVHHLENNVYCSPFAKYSSFATPNQFKV